MRLLEIERKFAFQSHLLNQFRRNMGSPPFTHLEFRGNKTIHDIYYEYRVGENQKKDILSSHGIWVRRRNNILEAKERFLSQSTLECKHDNPYLHTVFKELSSPRDIHALLSKHVPSPPLNEDPIRNLGLQPVIDFITFREEYVADHRFNIVLDRTCFGHRVGEIELLVERGTEEQARRDIDGLMDRYRWFFLDSGNGGKEEVVKGKLSAYFERFPVDSS